MAQDLGGWFARLGSDELIGLVAGRLLLGELRAALAAAGRLAVGRPVRPGRCVETAGELSRRRRPNMQGCFSGGTGLLPSQRSAGPSNLKLYWAKNRRVLICARDQTQVLAPW